MKMLKKICSSHPKCSEALKRFKFHINCRFIQYLVTCRPTVSYFLWSMSGMFIARVNETYIHYTQAVPTVGADLIFSRIHCNAFCFEFTTENMFFCLCLSLQSVLQRPRCKIHHKSMSPITMHQRDLLPGFVWVRQNLKILSKALIPNLKIKLSCYRWTHFVTSVQNK